MNDSNQDGGMDAGDGKPGAYPIPETIDDKFPKRGMEPELVNIAVACDRALAGFLWRKQQCLLLVRCH